MHDILILGAGPAGLSAAVAARQKNRSALVISNPSGQNPLSRAERIDNYLGMPGMNGVEMLSAFEEHARKMGADFVTGRVISAMALGEQFFLTVGSEVYEGRRSSWPPAWPEGPNIPASRSFWAGASATVPPVTACSTGTGRW